jgi:preprotein translocase subunit SecD
MSALRENWRIVVLAILVVGSTVALFVPAGNASANNNTTAPAAETTGPTNLRFGLELSGGTRIRAPLVGMTAHDVDVTPDEARDLEIQLADTLDVSRTDLRVAPETSTVEVFADEAHGNITEAEFASALQSAGYDISEDDIDPGVTEFTRQRTVEVLNNKINRGGLTGGSAQIATTPTGQAFVLVEVPNANRSAVLDLIGSEGRVEIVAHYPVEQNGTQTYENRSLITQGDFAEIGGATQGQGGRPPYVPVTLTDPAAEDFATTMSETGFTSPQGTENCRYDESPDDAGYCLYTVVDGKIVFASSMGSDLARSIESGDFEKDPRFQMTASSIEEARGLELNLQAGALPTSLAIQDEGTTYFLEPSLAQEFKLFSLATGLIAALAVAGVVMFRYGTARVGIPMFLTATAEVYLLLGFAAAIGLALDLSHIAGFIAVIGTGVDDLVIIADEILQSGDVRTGKVFRSRFRKAFWVIGAAAATTIVAMSPLAVLSLGDLQGFAIVTIVGVLIGVLITRPAYGDVLRNLILD